MTKRRSNAETMAKGQREISVSEFFAKNRHLLGIDNPRKALLTSVEEAVDNALDACEEAGIIPDLVIRIEELDSTALRAVDGTSATKESGSEIRATKAKSGIRLGEPGYSDQVRQVPPGRARQRAGHRPPTGGASADADNHVYEAQIPVLPDRHAASSARESTPHEKDTDRSGQGGPSDQRFHH